ncbi:DUF3108 domain-containing protein [Acinetobacter nectaris]|uniref:DUF3108 domain-containing protein n=1 Tax=Acinetobacter nectaris TaxID=1219382 RepID=UPI001F4470BD|nr:DUF3108 domain-containing protein [Acinetobacter nectaris]MCF9034545.1 DUF3108 domain-containing protein [Acinetobacter nectaris]
MQIKKFLQGALLTSAVMFSVHSFALTPFQATYQFAYNGHNISTATRTLQATENNHWTYKFAAKAGILASATEMSQFTFNNDKVISDKFSRATKYIGISDALNINFNHADKKVTTNKDGTVRSFPLENNPLDELNAEIQIREDLKNNRLKPVYYITDAKGIDARKFVNLGEETVKTQYGDFKTMKFKLEHNKPERNTLFWLAPQLDYLPVKVAHNDGANSYSISLINYKWQ